MRRTTLFKLFAKCQKCSSTSSAQNTPLTSIILNLKKSYFLLKVSFESPLLPTPGLSVFPTDLGGKKKHNAPLLPPFCPRYFNFISSFLSCLKQSKAGSCRCLGLRTQNVIHLWKLRLTPDQQGFQHTHSSNPGQAFFCSSEKTVQ